MEYSGNNENAFFIEGYMFIYNEMDDQQNQHNYPVLEWDGSPFWVLFGLSYFEKY